MQFKIIPWAEAGPLLAESKILYKTGVGHAHVHFVEHTGSDVIVVAPRQGKDVFLITEGDASGEHGCNMHATIRQLEAIVSGTGPSPGPGATDYGDAGPCEIVVEG